MILIKSRGWISYCPDKPRREISLATNPIVHFFPHRIVEKPVDCEIAAYRVRLRVCKSYSVWPPTVLVIRFGSESGDLELRASEDHDQNAKLPAYGYGAIEQRFDLVWLCRRRHVVIPGFPAKDHVSHASAHEVSLETGVLQFFNHCFGQRVESRCRCACHSSVPNHSPEIPQRGAAATE